MEGKEEESEGMEEEWEERKRERISELSWFLSEFALSVTSPSMCFHLSFNKFSFT